MVDVPRHDPTADLIARLQARGVKASEMEWRRGTLAPIEIERASGDVRPAIPQVLLDLWDALMLPGDVLSGKVGNDLYFNPEDMTVSTFNDPELIGRAAAFPIGRAAAFPAEIAMPGLGGTAMRGAEAALDPNTLNVFLGPKGVQGLGHWKNYQFDANNIQPWNGFPNSINYGRAESLQRQEAPLAEIYSKTGWFPGADGMMRTELPDYGLAHLQNYPEFSALQKFAGEKQQTAVGRLSDFLDHPYLFQAYPDFKDIPTTINHYKELPPDLREYGSFAPDYEAPGGGRININSVGEYPALSTMLHEIQHAIQVREGFAGGGNVDLTGDALSALSLHEQAAKGIPAVETQLSLPHPYELYRALQGEVESRNVQRRFDELMGLNGNLSPQFATRQDLDKTFPSLPPPWATEDHAAPFQISPDALYSAAFGGEEGLRLVDPLMDQLKVLKQGLDFARSQQTAVRPLVESGRR